MPQIRLKIPAWLTQEGHSRSSAFQEICVTTADLGSMIEELRSLAQSRRTLQDFLKDKTFGILRNGLYVNPDDPSENQLKEGDEVTFIPLLDGG